MSTCRDCRAPIRWAEHHRTGRRMPLNTDDVKPFGHGAFTVIDGKAYAGQAAIEAKALADAVSFGRAQQLLEDTAQWSTSHFADCPAAARFRR